MMSQDSKQQRGVLRDRVIDLQAALDKAVQERDWALQELTQARAAGRQVLEQLRSLTVSAAQRLSSVEDLFGEP